MSTDSSQIPLQSSMTRPDLILILAATPSLGIGKAGGLPWPQLRKEMGYFARVTKRILPSTSFARPNPQENHDLRGQARKPINAVIMGRKTWESIPVKFRPLKGRVNVIVTHSPENLRKSLIENHEMNEQATEEGPIVASGILDALSQLAPKSPVSASPTNHLDMHNLEVSRIFIIGGAALYTSALELPYTKHILLTKIHKEYDCDTDFPVNLDQSVLWRRTDNDRFQAFVGEENQGILRETTDSGEVEFEFGLWERVEQAE